jgi:topoisomerase IV subunit A
VLFRSLKITFGGKHQGRDPEEIDAESFIGVKGFKAKGKRLSNHEIKKVEELDPVRFKEENLPPEEIKSSNEEKLNEDDHTTGEQMSLDL